METVSRISTVGLQLALGLVLPGILMVMVVLINLTPFLDGKWQKLKPSRPRVHLRYRLSRRCVEQAVYVAKEVC